MKEVRLNVDKLREYIRENFTSDAEFAKMYGISPAYLSRVISGERSGSKLIIQLLSRGMGNRDFFVP